MFYSYLKTAWRNLLQNKTLSFINIIGLSLGVGFALLIGMWIHFEQSFDKFNTNKDRIAFVGRHLLLNNQKSTALSVMLPLYDELKANYPEVKRATRFDWGRMHSLVQGNHKFNKEGIYVDPDFLEMFTLEVIKGNPKTALIDQNAIVLTQSLANALFGSQDPIGKLITIDNQYPLQVTAVMKDVPKNSSIQFEFLAPFSFLIHQNEEIKGSRTRWNNNFLGTIIEIKEGTSMEALSQKLSPLLKDKDTGIKDQKLFLFPMVRWHLYDDFTNWVNTDGRIGYLRLFGIIGICVLLIACINFMNLATARSEKRAREVGIRKAVGSQRSQLIVQFLTESLLTSFVAFVLSLVLIQLILPSLSNFGLEDIRLDYSHPGFWMAVIAFCLVTGLLAGSYPAFYFSSFLPVRVLKGVLKQGKGTLSFRKFLVVSQFAISIGLIICTLVVFLQVKHAQTRPIGYNPDNLLMLNSNPDLLKNYNALKQDLLNTGYIEAVAKSSSGMTWVNNDFPHFSWEGKDPNTTIALDVVMTDWDYEKATQLTFLAGRPFTKEFATDSNSIILNEAALKLIGYKDPIGKTIKLGDKVLTIVGVIKNVLMRDPFKSVAPGVILFNTDNINVILIRLKNNAGLKYTLNTIEPIIGKYNASLPFDYYFADEEFAKKFTTENQVARLGGIFAGLAIFISCLGLFGLAMYMVERRAKEISIRKVLGASVTHLWLLLSREFVWMVVIAFLIASPITLWVMNGWLRRYEYRVEIYWWIFAIAGILAISIALVTVSVQAIKAALANPANRLRTE
ncbi:ABC transporter permease [Xanthocytophaga agilis]|uniref:ABC transporter permease n=1 Tax=Xanthocytophaga agilis TaxID=3048010 RepID=A0AAE3R844_9BACT|nr:ABC transporter permease [Xanthocytophaga agilis]MDJ1505616.1 ABC transporter permease [Xanthocytophaga agilis]